jgi:hypothetical protein
MSRREEGSVTIDKSRRFTDKEVALVLRKASELEEAEGTGPGGGLSLLDLEQIAAEVGISREVLNRAVAALDNKAGGNPFARGQLVHQVIRAVDGELSENSVSELIQHVDGTSDQVGVVSEALGSIQWTARDRFRTYQVSIKPSEGETRIRVIERATARLRTFVATVPTMMGAALVAGSIGGFDPSSGMVAILTAMGAVAGAVVGRVLWRQVSSGSEARVKQLAADLTRQAEAAIESGKPEEPPP